ncbi:MAG: hypothetical protein HC908_15500 [Calothrix sp. SM1_7_51]|nr:hypothetical protein [Calothrix sp. SM1_7_51]
MEETWTITKAEAAINQSLNLNQNSKLLAETLEIQGSLQLELGKPEQALDTWKNATNIYLRDGNELGQIRSLINQSLAQQALGLYRHSRNTLENINHRLAKQPRLCCQSYRFTQFRRCIAIDW